MMQRVFKPEGGRRVKRLSSILSEVIKCCNGIACLICPVVEYRRLDSIHRRDVSDRETRDAHVAGPGPDGLRGFLITMLIKVFNARDDLGHGVVGEHETRPRLER